MRVQEGEGKAGDDRRAKASFPAFCRPQRLRPEGAPEGKFSINPLWDKSIEKGRLLGIRLDGIWMHIDRPDAVTDAERFLADLAPAA